MDQEMPSGPSRCSFGGLLFIPATGLDRQVGEGILDSATILSALITEAEEFLAALKE